MHRPHVALSHLSTLIGVAFAMWTAVAGALPPASGSKCSANWVNNQAAMACFIQGEEEIRNGVRNPHYVACTAAGEIFCCQDKNGGQDCDAVSAIVIGPRPNIDNVRLRAMLESQRSVSTLLGQVAANLDKLAGSTSAGMNARASEEAALRTISQEWARVAAAKDLERTLSYYAEDASMFPPNMPIATGPDARRKVWTGAFAERDFAFSNSANRIEVAQAGDLAYETGTYRMSYTDTAGKPVRLNGKYVVVWKKQPTGQWKAIIDAFNADQ